MPDIQGDTPQNSSQVLLKAIVDAIAAQSITSMGQLNIIGMTLMIGVTEGGEVYASMSSTDVLDTPIKHELVASMIATLNLWKERHPK